jgi:imidazolonepropionase-like amidohydrolase
MDRERVLEDHTVVVRDGVIEAVAPSYRVDPPAGAEIIEGDGLFLMPGLADLNVSLPSGQASTQEIQDFLFLLLANNVMTVRGLDGSSAHVRLKRDVASGVHLGPTVWPGAPALGGADARDGQAAIDRMMQNRRSGYDFQTLSGDIPPTAWDSLAEEAHSRGYTFGGTIPRSVGLRKALSTGISTVEHLDGYLEEVVSDAVRSRLDAGAGVPLAEQVAAVEGRKVRAMAAHTRSSDTWVIPTLHRWELLYGTPSVDSLLLLPEMAYVPDYISGAWIVDLGSTPPTDPETGQGLLQVRRRILRALTMAGVGVMMGTDSPSPFHVPGFALRHELRSMARAGLTPYEILVTGTRNVAEYARKELLEPAEFGTVTEANRADLVLLRANPLADLEALWDQEGIMVRGRWIPRAEIDERLADIRTRIGG